jgi:hypothetical protein
LEQAMAMVSFDITRKKWGDLSWSPHFFHFPYVFMTNFIRI